MYMKSKGVLFSKGKNDECYTPAYGVRPILKYIPKNAIVWCPFDTENSEFVKQISVQNKVIYKMKQMETAKQTIFPNNWEQKMATKKTIIRN